jgi:uncharacterized protein (TIGR00725 family)
VAVVGPAAGAADVLAAAEEVGRLLAERGALVVTGGKGGAMEAACRGAKSAGGTTLGVLPDADRAGANEFVDVALATGLGELRNGLVVRAVDAVIAVGGAYGTLSEIALALRGETPVIGLDTWELARAGQPDTTIRRATTPAEAVDLALSALGPGH